MEGPEGRSKNPYIALAICLPKTSSLKQAGWFKKLFRKIAKFFQKVINAVVKILQKVQRVLQKFMQTGFGKVVGNFLGVPLILSALNIAINTFSYLGQGDIKGLFKYWGQNAIQIALMAASFALMFIPGVGQALAAGLKFLFQGLFAAVQFVLGAAIQLLGTAISGMGSFIGNFSVGLGGLVRGAGSFLSQAGTRLMSQAQASMKELFSNLKSAFSRVTESLNRSLGGYRPNASPLPPHAGIEIGRTLPDGVSIYGACRPGMMNFAPCGPGLQREITRSGIFDNGLFKIIQKVGEAVSFQWLEKKIDQRIEKSKMNSFLKTILSTVSTAGLQAIGSAVTDDIFPPQQAPAEATRSRAPPTNQPGVFARVLGSVGSVITNALKDAAGFVKSIFISDKVSSDSLSPAFEDLFQEKLGQLDLDSEGNPYRLRLLEDRARIEYAPRGERPTQGLYSFDLDQGNRQILRIDPTTKAILSQERIGNLGAPSPSLVESLKGAFSSFNEARYLFSDALNLGIDSGIDSLIGSPDGLPSWAYISSYTILHTAGDFIKGTADFVNLGRDLPAIFSHLQQGFKAGELKQAALNYLFTGQPFSPETPNLFQAASLSLNELNRAFIAGSGVIGALRGVGRGVGFSRNAITRGFQEHHIISNKNPLTRQHELFELSGVDIESRTNKIFLPREPSLHPTRSIHSGRHLESVSGYFRNRMDDIVRTGRQQGWTQAQYRKALRELIAEERQLLRSGERALNKNRRPWSY